jgi:hypothetical protein
MEVTRSQKRALRRLPLGADRIKRDVYAQSQRMWIHIIKRGLAEWRLGVLCRTREGDLAIADRQTQMDMLSKWDEEKFQKEDES